MNKKNIGPPGNRPRITIRDLDSKDLTRTAPSLLPAEVHVWEIALDAPAAIVAECAKLLSSDECQRASRFHFERDARRFTVTRGRLRALLGAYLQLPAHELRFMNAQHGKPRLSNATGDVRFNVSHSGDRALVAFTLAREIGVDIEQIKTDLEFDRLAERFFSMAERNYMRSLSKQDGLRTFFRFWTCKEAFLKAQGVGLTVSLSSFTVDLTGKRVRLLTSDSAEAAPWTLTELDAPAGYAAATVVEGPITGLQVLRLQD